MFRVMLDAGHGGSDPGAVSGGLQEKDVVLNVALMTYAILDEISDIEPRLTRWDDDDVSLAQRAEFANEVGADVFVSIHCNASPDEVPQGIETWHYTGSDDGYRLASQIQRQLLPLATRDRGLKHTTGFAVLRRTRMPAALVEIGFITNPRDRELFQDPRYLKRVAMAIARGIISYRYECEISTKSGGVGNAR